MSEALTFDRTNDVSKLEGCNTRGLEYRWDIFARHMKHIPTGGSALDFGAGSLRESFDLVNRGLSVTSVDLDLDTLNTYKAKYSWPPNSNHEILAGADLLQTLSRVGGKTFSVLTCFDVLEHLEAPALALRALAAHMRNDSVLFVTVPNGRTLFELAWSIDLKLARMTGRHIRPGEPHLQRNSPDKWRKIIASAGLSVIDHEMQIGFFANTGAALIQLPLTLGGRILRKLGIKLDALSLSERLIARSAASMDYLDRHTRFLSSLYGWNLFVISKPSQSSSFERIALQRGLGGP